MNRQFNMELFSSNQYLAMCSYFMDEELDGFANFFRVQAAEEHMHAMKIFDFLHEVDGKIEMRAIDPPKNEYNDMIEVFEDTLAHEQKVSRSIYDLVDMALEEKDHATNAMLQWFVSEQVEEEALVKNLLQKLKMVGDNSSALYLLNDELNKRSAPAPEGE